MKNKLQVIGLFIASLSLSLSGCKGNTSSSYSSSRPSESSSSSEEPIPPVDRSNFYGICCLAGVGAVDKGLTDEWNTRCIKGMGFTTQRVWLSLYDLFSVDENDNLTVKPSYKKVMESHIAACKAGGIKKFLAMYTSFIYPYGTSHCCSYMVPDPYDDVDLYYRFLLLMKKAASMVVELFPDLNILEVGNEPDTTNTPCIHKDGYINGGDIVTNMDYVYNDSDKASIICDMCYYTKQGIKEANSDCKVSIPGLTYYAPGEFLKMLYERIESHTLPYGTKYSIIDPDEYFDYLNWHPYGKPMDYRVDIESWVTEQKEIYEICCEHGDKGKPVLFSELGWTTGWSSDKSTKGQEEYCSEFISNQVKAMVDIVWNQLPFVESLYYFRLTDLHFQTFDARAEETFGMFYHPNDPTVFETGSKVGEEKRSQPKAFAYILAKCINGENYDLDAHLDPYVSPYDD